MLIYCYSKWSFCNVFVTNYFETGSENQNSEPCCGAFLTPTSPLRLLARFFTIAKPNPLPFFSDALASAVLKNLSNIKGLSSSEIPFPLSVIVTTILSSFVFDLVDISITEFSSLYLKALSIKFVRIRSKAFLSARTN